MTRTETRPPADPASARAARRQERDRRAERVEQRLAVPVILAAAVSVPAVFLTILAKGAAAQLGWVLNWASLIVLAAESAILFLLTGDRLAWLWRHKWTIGITAVAVPAVIFAIAPVQAMRVVLRVVQFVGALRILRANRIIKAGLVLARRLGLTGWWRHAAVVAGSVVAAVFVAVILRDPTSQTRSVLDSLGGWPRMVLVLLAGAILAAATFVVLRTRSREGGRRDDPDR